MPTLLYAAMILTHHMRVGQMLKLTWKNLFFSGITSFAAYYINELWLSHYFTFPAFVPTILGMALAFFIGFNNNQAYDRWWEARKIWGSLVNNSRTWARQILCYITQTVNPSSDELNAKKTRLIKRHIAFLYALKNNLRNSNAQEHLQYLTADEVNKIGGQTNIHNAILSLQSADLEWLYRQGIVDGYKFIEMNRMITGFCDDMGKSERIKNTVYPTTYSYYSRLFIWFFVYSVTMSIGNSIGIFAVIFGTLTGYVFFTIQTIGELLLDPFEYKPTGIPLDQITRTIEINLLEMMGEKNIPEQVESVNGEYIL